MRTIDTDAVNPISREEIYRRLNEDFERHVKGRGYFHMDDGGRYYPSWVNEYDRLLGFFPRDIVSHIEGLVSSSMSRSGTHRIMQQGCGHASSLDFLLRRLAIRFPNSNFEGYAIGGDFNSLCLGLRDFDSDLTKEERRRKLEHGILPIMRRYSPSRVRYFFMERDIHQAMMDFPNQLDLVFSDNTYMHLTLPWLAMKRTIDKLAVCGVAVVRTIRLSDRIQCIGLGKSNDFLDHLRRLNPSFRIYDAESGEGHAVVVVVKNEEKPFRTDLKMGKTLDDSGYEVLLTARSIPQNQGFQSLDDL